ncbi:MAG: hypothetical protein EXR70_17715 [Deltaproteobacteria bacterium]|nr:hypothetical protein [Deltaproteobacteria bacterium]
MINKPWDERIVEELTPPEVVAAIEGADLLIECFGEWPSFEDAEVLALNLDRGNHWWVLETGKWDQRIPPRLTATFYVFDFRYSGDAPERKPTEAVIRFEEFEDFEIDGFNHQNPIVGLGIKYLFSKNLKKNLFSVDWGGTGIKHEASFTCGRIQVISVEPIVWSNSGSDAAAS